LIGNESDQGSIMLGSTRNDKKLTFHYSMSSDKALEVS
jgi:hypothetical protein